MSKSFVIGNRVIDNDNPPYIIAECGINHNGDIDIAKKMVSVAKEVGADAVKFQTFNADEFIQDKELKYTYTSQGEKITESMYDMFKRYEFSYEEWNEIKLYCDKQQITFLSTPQNESDLKLLMELDIQAIKIGSDDFVNIPLIRKYASYNLPLLLSCGMANKNEIDTSLKEAGLLKNKPIVLFLCTSEYPTPEQDVNILKLKTLSSLYPEVTLGFSDHTVGVEAAVLAVACGARVYEKHFTLDNNFPGPDHWFSENPEGLKNWIDSINKSYKMLGSEYLKPTEKEEEMRILAHRSITAIEDINVGDLFTEYNLGMRRPGDGIPSSEWDNVIGKKALKYIKKNTQIKEEDYLG